MKVEAIVWKMEQGKITVLKYDNQLFPCDGLSKIRHGRPPALDVFLRGKKPGFVFTLEEFFQKHPDQRYRQEFNDRIITNHLANKILAQMGDLGKDTFKLLKTKEKYCKLKGRY